MIVPTLEETVVSGNRLAASDKIAEIRSELAALEKTLASRTEAITGTAV